MDKEKEIENIQSELKSLKGSNPSLFNSIKDTAKLYVSEHKEIETDTGLQLMLRYAIWKIGKDKVDDILKRHYTLYSGPLEELMKGTNKDPSSQLNFLYTKFSASVERATLAHNVYVLSRSKINKNVEFPKEEPDPETGIKKKHDTMSISLWDNDLKRVVSLFIKDNDIKDYSALEINKSYRMQLGNYVEEKHTQYLSKDPSITPLDGSFKVDFLALGKYLIDNFPHVKEPYSDLIDPDDKYKKFVIRAQYVKKPSYVSLIDLESEKTEYSIGMFYGGATNELKNDDGKCIVFGTFQKLKPKESKNGQPAIQAFDYVINPEVVIDLSEPRQEPKETKQSQSQTEEDNELPVSKSEKQLKAELDDVL